MLATTNGAPTIVARGSRRGADARVLTASRLVVDVAEGVAAVSLDGARAETAPQGELCVAVPSTR